jgi:arabinogalactan endo-1,4-beta-galactosidase
MRNLLLITLLFCLACSVTNTDEAEIQEGNPDLSVPIRSVDFSGLPEIESHGISYFDSAGVARDPLEILKENGVNSIRLRLWHSPSNEHSSFAEVKAFAERIRELDLELWLTVHYSDSWADPGQQRLPQAWLGLNDFNILRDSLYNYTAKIMEQIDPDIIQIGNEINSGLLHPWGEINSNAQAMDSLLISGIRAVRDIDPDTKIMLHYAGYEGAEWFFNRLPDRFDYDMIGISYYPFWHGKDLRYLRTTLENLRTIQQKEVLIAETSYPFTLGWADYTNNTIGSQEQILDEYDATFEGQKAFLERIFSIADSSGAIGVAYYGAEQVAFDGPTSTSGSYWENQSLFDFNVQEVPALKVFRDFE